MLLLAAVVGFAISGYRQGSVVGVLSLVGFVGGALLGAQIATPLANAFGVTDSGGQSPGFGLITVVATAVIGQIVAAAIGARLRSRLTWKPLRALDSVAGAVVSAVSVLLVAWALGHVIVRTDHPQIRSQVTRSVILKRVDAIVPGGADSLLAALLRLVNQTGFPAVFPGLGIEQIVPVAPPDPSVLDAPGVRSAYPSIVKINGEAPECERSIEGSGFVFGTERVMTNAHVVAGVSHPTVSTPGGQVIKATVVLFDPLRDVAVLAVPGLDARRLPFGPPLATGASATVAGYPNNMPFDPLPARVRALRSAENYDIYSTQTVTREEYSLFTQVRPGNSGGPLLDTSGRVAGVVFATSTDDPNTGYALSAREVSGDAKAGLTATGAVSTQGCD